jgi:hypothetical protein
VQLKDMPVQGQGRPRRRARRGPVQAYASVFGNKDSYGDVVVKGAFANT